MKFEEKYRVYHKADGMRYFGDIMANMTMDGNWWLDETPPMEADKCGYTFMESVGYKNKSGYVYDGDILKGNHDDNFVIVPCLGGLSMINVMYYKGENFEAMASPVNGIQASIWIKDSKTIGNIHENRELLKTKKS